jgi:hypothetical protein
VVCWNAPAVMTGSKSGTLQYEPKEARTADVRI